MLKAFYLLFIYDFTQENSAEVLEIFLCILRSLIPNALKLKTIYCKM